jgi:threonine dehydrogenase-like Zn-dependent dehydrogenase
MSPVTARAAVVVAPRVIEFRDIPLPTVGDDEILVEVEANGVCGSDLELFEGTLPEYPLPLMLGHEPLGRISVIGASARARWRVDVGDRVVVNSALRCGRCRGCLGGGGCLLRSQPGGYGSIGPDASPGLWGGFSTHLFLPAEATLVPMSSDVDLAAAAFNNPLANGFEWSLVAGGVRPGDVVLVIGAGPRGIACALAAIYCGAKHVTVVGLAQDAGRLDMARAMGVQQTIIVEGNEPDAILGQITFERPRVVIDTAPRSSSATVQGVTAVRDGGTVVLAGIKGGDRTLDVSIDVLSRRRLTLVGPTSRTMQTMELAVRAIEGGRLPLDLLTSAGYPLERSVEAIDSLRSNDVERPLHVRIEPNA